MVKLVYFHLICMQLLIFTLDFFVVFFAALCEFQLLLLHLKLILGLFSVFKDELQIITEILIAFFLCLNLHFEAVN